MTPDGPEAGEVPSIDTELLAIMQCPVARVPLVQVGSWLYATDRETRRKYPIRDGIPIMLINESEVADTEEFDRVMRTIKTNSAPGRG